ncbi:MAG: hypothetical protein WBP61_18730 [Nocardioides sp.]
MPSDAPAHVAKPGRRGVVLAVAAILALVLVAGTVGVMLALTGSGDDDPAATAPLPGGAANGAEVDDPPSQDPGGDVATDASTEPAPEPEPEPEVTCWNGSSALRVDRCPSPDGRPGLRWIFPSVSEESCVARRGIRDRPAMYSCTEQLPNGGEIDFNYSQWVLPQYGYDHYDELAYDKESWPGDRTRWRIISSDGEFKAALMYRGEPWSVSIYADTAAELERAIANVLEMRPRDELNGTGS